MTKAIGPALALALALPFGQAAWAQDDAACGTVRMSDPGWTDITSTNAIASVLLEALGYEADISTLSVPVGYEAMKSGDTDVFLGNWMPSHVSYREDLDSAGAIEVLTKNLTGAKFTLAVPTYVSEQGVTDFADLDEHADAFDSEIYGIEPGAVANQHILRMIEADDFGLGDWSIVESGEQAMLSQVTRAERSEDWIVFLAWAPHPMNTAHELTYLSGGDEYFGPNYGGAEVYTLARTGWPEQCPNAAQLFRNLVFDIDMENEMMRLILEEGMAPEDAARSYLQQHPDVIEPWLEGVKTIEGEPGLPAVREALGL
jgi:glycine betaine/proline transport system substrate-binding protein